VADPDDAVDEPEAAVELAALDDVDEDDELPLLPQAASAAAQRMAMGAKRQLLNMNIHSFSGRPTKRLSQTLAQDKQTLDPRHTALRRSQRR
jgi:hypothetical protein